MNPYDRYLLPRLTDLACSAPMVSRARARVVPAARGEVLEVGFGSGLNLRWYDPARVTRLWALEPSAEIRRLAAARVAASPLRIDFLDLPGERVPLPDASVDTVVVTFTLCTIPDVAAAAREMRRVLRPDGELLFAEHGLAPGRVARCQRRIEPFWTPLAGGCHLTRRPPTILREAGFEVESEEGPLDRGALARSLLGFVAYGYVGRARPRP